MADSSATTAALEPLHDIVVAESVSMMPGTIGWGLAAVALSAVGLWILWRVIRHRRLTRYRREALTELDRIEQQVGKADGTAVVFQLATLLKRTALSGYGRTRTASLAGKGWLAFLDQSRGGSEFMEKGQPLIAYGVVTISDDRLKTLVRLARGWIRGHDVRV